MAKPITAGPFSSVVDPSDPGTRKPTRLIDAINMRVPDPKRGSAAVQRHGVLALDQQLGVTPLARTGQGTHEHRRADGTVDRYSFGGGRMYEWDGAQAFTDITPVGVVIDFANPVFAVTFDEKIVVSDETNKPWVFDPLLGTAALIEYNTAGEEWATKGGPVVYSARVFFIVKSAGSSSLIEETAPFDFLATEDDVPLITEALAGVQNTIAWSAPLDARLGYDQNDYDNLWTLTQSSSNLLTCLFADEAALTYLRTQGIGYITGKVEEDFRTSATTDAISGTTGTDAPAAVIVVDRKAWFVDMDGRVHRMAPTAKPEELWLPMRRTVDAHIGTAQCRDDVRRHARAGYHEGYKLVLFTIWDAQTLYAFDAQTGEYMGTWSVYTGVHVTAMGSLVDAFNRSTFLLIGTSGATDTPAAHGTVWRQKFPDDGGQWHDQTSGTGAPLYRFTRAIETHWLQHAGSLVFRALSAVASLFGSAARHAVGLAYTVPKSGRSATLVARSTTGTGTLPGEPPLATAWWSLGKNAQGSAIRVRVSAESTDDVQFAVHGVEVEIQTVKAKGR